MGMLSNSPRKIFNDWESNGLPAGTHNIGDVDVLTVAAGETHIGEVGVKWGVTTSTIYLDTGAVAALDNAASGVAAYGAIEFTNAARAAGRGGIIRSVVFADTALQSPDFTMFLFSAVPGTTHGLVNAAFQLADADLVNVVGLVAAGTKTIYSPHVNSEKAWQSVIDGGIQIVPTAIPFVCATGTSLYGRIRADAAWDAAAASDLTVKLLVEQG